MQNHCKLRAEDLKQIEKVLEGKLVGKKGVKCLGMKRQIIKMSKRRGIAKRIKEGWKHDQEKEGDNANKRK